MKSNEMKNAQIKKMPNARANKYIIIRSSLYLWNDRKQANTRNPLKKSLLQSNIHAKEDERWPSTITITKHTNIEMKKALNTLFKRMHIWKHEYAFASRFNQEELLCISWFSFSAFVADAVRFRNEYIA